MSLLPSASLKRWFLSLAFLFLLLNLFTVGFAVVLSSEFLAAWQLAAFLTSGVFSLILCITGVYYYRWHLAAPLRTIQSWFKAEGSSERQLSNMQQNAEISHLAADVDALMQKVQRTTVLLEEIGRGNLEVELTAEGYDKDALSQALLTTRTRLLENQEAGRQRNWSAEGITQLEELLRKNNSSLDALAEVVVQFLVKYLAANQGALFLVQEDQGDLYLEMASCYAYERKKFMEKRLQPGEGLVGQAFLEKAPIYLTEVPQQYTTITSGLGEATPGAIILVPLQVEEKVVGVLELASFTAFTEHQQSFLNKATQSIASSVMNVQVNMKTGYLLKRSQQQTEELRAQEEEMRQNMEEMETTQEEMARISSEMQGQLGAINHTMATIAFTPEGTILEANENFLQLMGYTLNEVQEKHHSMFVEADERESEAYQEFWQQLGQGKPTNGEFKRITKSGKEVYIRGIYNPLVDRSGKVIKVLKLAYDISESKRMERDMAGQLKAINGTMATISFKPDGTILEANDNFLQLMGYGLKEIQNHHHSMFVSDEEKESEEYKAFWQQLANGENKNGEFRRITKSDTTVYIRGIYNPIFNQQGKVEKVLKLAYDISESKQMELKIKNQLEETKAQEEELRQNMEELSATQEEMARLSGEMEGQLAAINHTMATIAFTPEGTILDANGNFLQLMEYEADEIMQKHHRIFVEQEEQSSAAYKQFWQELGQGQNKNGEFRRLTKGGREVFIRGIYNPIRNSEGKVIRVLKLAYDITESKKVEQEMNGQLNAINQTMATISFSPEGTILEANDNFLSLMGYGEQEVTGRHHQMFVEPKEAESDVYKDFWKTLAKGESKIGDFRRINKGGDDVFIRGIYNPVCDKSGRVVKVFKLAYALESA